MQWSPPSAEREVVLGHFVNSGAAVARGQWVMLDCSATAVADGARGERVLAIPATNLPQDTPNIIGCAEIAASAYAGGKTNTFPVVVYGHHPEANVWASGAIDPVSRNGDVWVTVDAASPDAGSLRAVATPSITGAPGCGGYLLEEITAGETGVTVMKNVWVRCMKVA